VRPIEAAAVVVGIHSLVAVEEGTLCSIA